MKTLQKIDELFKNGGNADENNLFRNTLQVQAIIRESTNVKELAAIYSAFQGMKELETDEKRNQFYQIFMTACEGQARNMGSLWLEDFLKLVGKTANESH